MATKRRNRLIPRGAVECFEIRIVTSLTADGTVMFAEITTPSQTDYPSRAEMLGAIEDAKIDLIKLYDDEAGE